MGPRAVVVHRGPWQPAEHRRPLRDPGVHTNTRRPRYDRALSKSGISRDEFIDTHVPDRPRTKYGQRTEQCRVERNGVRCARRFDVRGLCRRHHSEWRTHSRQNPAIELGSWVTCVAEPLGPEQERMCLVLGCLLTPRGAIPLCPLHYTRRKTNTPDTPVTTNRGRAITPVQRHKTSTQARPGPIRGHREGKARRSRYASTAITPTITTVSTHRSRNGTNRSENTTKAQVTSVRTHPPQKRHEAPTAAPRSS
jgi:hypothetical protein